MAERLSYPTNRLLNRKNHMEKCTYPLKISILTEMLLTHIDILSRNRLFNLSNLIYSSQSRMGDETSLVDFFRKNSVQNKMRKMTDTVQKPAQSVGLLMKVKYGGSVLFHCFSWAEFFKKGCLNCFQAQFTAIISESDGSDRLKRQFRLWMSIFMDKSISADLNIAYFDIDMGR